MKVFNITFKGHQPFTAQQLIVAESEQEAREGASLLLGSRIPGFEIEKVEDVTNPDPATETEVVLN